MSDHDNVSIIIATTASRERGAPLRRALDSLRLQSSAKALPIVVVNGSNRDAETIGYLRACTDLRLIELEHGDLPAARARGREAVDTDFFGVLDDDDEYLPEALSIRLAAIKGSDTTDAVVTSGLRRANGCDEPWLEKIETFQDDPLNALVTMNWLPSCGGLFRTRTIGIELFSSMPRYLEWTYLAFLLSSERNVLFVGKPTYRIHADTPNSMTKLSRSAEEAAVALEKIHNLDLPLRIKRRVKQMQLAAFHDAAVIGVVTKNLRYAWRRHWQSLGGGRGLRYLTFTRHILFTTVKALIGRENEPV